VLAGTSVVALAVLLVYEPRHTDPLLELRFFRSVPFSGATLTAVAGFCAYGAFLFLNTLYLQDVRGFSALQAGLCTLPVAVLIVVMAPISGEWSVGGGRGCRCWSPGSAWRWPGCRSPGSRRTPR